MFDASFFASPDLLVTGALTGLVFGFLLQKGQVTRFDTIVGQFLLKDHTVLKTMATAIVVGGLGVYAMFGFGLIESLPIKSTQLLANALGGLVFGVGMAILGYCPGTGVAAIGDGARDAIFGVLGMIVGAGLYAEIEPLLATSVLKVGDLGKVTLAGESGLSPFVWLVALGAAVAGMWLKDRRARGIAYSA